MDPSKTSDSAEHYTDPYLRKLRMKRDLRTADVEIICAEMQTDFLHSSIGVVHSNYVRTMVECHNAPLRIALLNCKYKAVSAVIDWMYTGKIQVEVNEYKEHLKTVRSLGVNKLQQNLETALELLADRNAYTIRCINIATDPECSVSSVVQETICKKFVAIMSTFSDTDILKLTLNAITTLVASPEISSKEKIDALNFAFRCFNEPESDPIIANMEGPEQLTSDDNQELVDTYVYQHPELFNLSSELWIQQKQNLQSFSGSDVSMGIQLAAAGAFKEKDKAFKRQFLGPQNFVNASHSSNHFLSGNNVSTKEQTIERNAFSNDGLTEVQKMQNLFLHDSTGKSNRKTNARKTNARKNNARNSNPKSTTKFNSFSQLLSNNSRTVINPETPSGAGKISSPSAKNINKNFYGVESVTDIADIPNHFHTQRFFTPNLDHYLGGRRAVYNLTEEIRVAKDILCGFGGVRNVMNNCNNHENSQKSYLHAANSDTFGAQSLADIRAIKNPFLTSYYLMLKQVMSKATAEE